MKILFTSDWHVDWSTDGHPRHHEIETAVDHSIRVAIEEGVNAYVFAGDLTDPDSNLTIKSQAFAIRKAAELKKAGIPSYWIAGNHDVVEDGFGTTTLTPLAASGLAHVFEEPTITAIGNLKVMALPFTPRSHAYDTAKWVRSNAVRMPQAERSQRLLVVGHLSLNGIHEGSETSEMPRGREVSWPLEELKKWFPNSILVGGHYHKTQEWDGVQIVGALARLTHGEEENEPTMLLMEI